jgi:signal transduction histidine kinase
MKYTDLSISGIKQPPYEVELYHKDGSIRTLKVREVPVFDNNHNVIAVEGIAEDITKHKHAEEKFVNYQTQLKRLTSALSLAEERERRHISEELHDRIGQTLTVIKMMLEDIQETQIHTDTDGVFKETRELLDQAIKDTRTLTFELSPPVLYELGFEPAVEWLVDQFKKQHSIAIDFVGDGLTGLGFDPAVEWLVDQFKKQHNITIDFSGGGLTGMLEEDVSFFLFKSVRELLFNVIKHARAHKIKVTLLKKDNKIRIDIDDDGVGFDFSKTQFSVNDLSGFGLFSIRERMEHFGGNLDVKSKPGQGTCVTLTMPLKQQEGDADAK